MHFCKEIQTQSRTILNSVFVSLHLAAAITIWLLSFLLSAKCFVNTLHIVSRESGVKQSEQRDAAQPDGKYFSKPFLTFWKLSFLTDFCMAADKHVTAPCGCWLPLPEFVACVLELTFMEWLVSAG